METICLLNAPNYRQLDLSHLLILVALSHESQVEVVDVQTLASFLTPRALKPGAREYLQPLVALLGWMRVNHAVLLELD